MTQYYPSTMLPPPPPPPMARPVAIIRSTGESYCELYSIILNMILTLLAFTAREFERKKYKIPPATNKTQNAKRKAIVTYKHVGLAILPG